MPPKAVKESLVMLINIGVTCPNMENNPSLLEKAKHIAKRKIEEMIFFKPKDEIAILLMGSPNTKNSLSTDHVEEFANFQIPNWDLIEQLMALQGTKHCSNWVEALDAGVEFMKRNVIDVTVKKVILMSDFKEEEDIIQQFQADAIAEKLSAEKIKLMTIAEESLDERPANPLKISEVLLKDLHKKINGQHTTFDNAISELKFYTKAPTKPNPSYFTLEFVDKKIPIVSYVKIDDPKFPSWQKAKDNQKTVSKTQYYDRQRNLYEKDQIVAGYKYGGTFIPVEEESKKDMNVKSGEKGYKIHSFTDRKNIRLEHQYESAHVILPSSEEKNVVQQFYSLVQALHETNSVAIARKLYRNNCVPKMVALFPCTDIPDEPWCLVEIALAFAEDCRIMEVNPVKSAIKQLTSEQNEAVDNLIDSLRLPDTEDNHEVDDKSRYFLPGCVPNPAVQYRWHMLAYRALNPGKPLPPMEDYLKEIFDVPSMIKDKSKCHLEKIAQLFQLESIDPKAKEKNETKKKETNMQIDDDHEIKNPLEIENKHDVENKSSQEYVLSLDTSDIDMDELAANI
ncbi:X-ray repair cross-complementing protein 5 [Anthophora quadrimaculata]